MVHRPASPERSLVDTACGRPLRDGWWSIDPARVTCAACLALRPEPEPEWVPEAGPDGRVRYRARARDPRSYVVTGTAEPGLRGPPAWTGDPNPYRLPEPSTGDPGASGAVRRGHHFGQPSVRAEPAPPYTAGSGLTGCHLAATQLPPRCRAAPGLPP